MEPTDITTPDTFVYKVVLTGGPCAGKTTTLVRLRTFFENLGWKVYTVPETATILLGTGVKFAELTYQQGMGFQSNILRTILQIEKTIFDLAKQDKGKVLIVCDRGAMDPSAYCTEEEWQSVLQPLDLDMIQIRDKRYDQIVHMVSSASGAEQFYQLTNNAVRSEGLELARELDVKAAQAWVGHPYFDVVDNSTDFETKIRRVIEVVCKRLGKRGMHLEVNDRLKALSKKRKFLVKSLPDMKQFPKIQDFDVQHDYLVSIRESQYRLRKRGQRGLYMYTLTDRKIVDGQKVESVRHLSKKEYETLKKQKDPAHMSVLKTRRCFLWNCQYFQLDIFREPCTERCKGLLLLETYTTNQTGRLDLPFFVEVLKEVTSETVYSMYHLSDTAIS